MSPAPETPAETLLSVVKLDAQGLVPVIAQEIETGMVRIQDFSCIFRIEALFRPV